MRQLNEPVHEAGASPLSGYSNKLDKMLAGEIEATAAEVIGECANIDGVQAEFKSALGAAEVVEAGRKVPPKPGEKALFDVDVVADNVKTWIDVKRVEPFGIESSNWKGKPGTGGGMAKKGLRDMATWRRTSAMRRGTTPSTASPQGRL